MKRLEPEGEAAPEFVLPIFREEVPRVPRVSRLLAYIDLLAAPRSVLGK